VEQQRFHILIATTTRHEGDGEEGARLGPRLASVRLEAGLIADVGISIDRGIIVAVPFPRIDQEFIHGGRVHAGRVRDKICSEIPTRANALRVIGLNATRIVAGVGHPIYIHARGHLLEMS